jgi:hypothetical protein
MGNAAFGAAGGAADFAGAGAVAGGWDGAGDAGGGEAVITLMGLMPSSLEGKSLV